MYFVLFSYQNCKVVETMLFVNIFSKYTARYTMVLSAQESYMEYKVDWLIINLHVVDKLITSRRHVFAIDNSL